ncbi:hypothetical protein KP509_38G053900 [Ceratopteris richardii]|uniref:Uncharacterized protein n=1 Tax=Ceratopteris richardii TaxID=49495 RepID=A0A8T2Q512_CERRI|nr:hypothetical protein KP509_38G053900 [Ceratopteris richardii]
MGAGEKLAQTTSKGTGSKTAQTALADGASDGGGFFKQLRRSFTSVHRPADRQALSQADGAHKASGNGGFFVQLRRSLTSRRAGRSEVAVGGSAAAAPKPVGEVGGGVWGKRVKQGLSRPIKVVTDSYVACMLGISESGRVDSLGSMGFNNPRSPQRAFLNSASSRFDRSFSCPPPNHPALLRYPELYPSASSRS